MERQTVLSGGAATVWARWQGRSLLIHHRRAIGADGSTSTTRSFTLSDDGKTLTSVPTFGGRQSGQDVAEYGRETEIWEKL